MNLRMLLVHPGASWSTADVYDGLLYGLVTHGATVIPFRLDLRLDESRNYAWSRYRRRKKYEPAAVKPTPADISYHASMGVLEMAMRHAVHVVLIVSATLLHPDVIVMLRRAGVRVVVLFTESPYDHEQELRIAAIVDGCWTHERSVVEAFRAVNPHTGYLPHAWHPEKHFVSARPIDDADVPRHDVVFVGSAFAERVTWFNAIDWTGIDLGLYGIWKDLGLAKPVRACVRSGPIGNAYASALYRRAKIGLNLYRTSKGWARRGAPQITHAESLSPRAYELAACGVFSLSEYRAEIPEVFGDRVPTFGSAAEAAALIRVWLADEAGRHAIAADLPACVAEASWIHRAATVLGDLSRLLHSQAA